MDAPDDSSAPLARSFNRFGAALFEHLRTRAPVSNFVLAPSTVAAALALAGAAGRTAAQIGAALGLDGNADDMHVRIGSLVRDRSGSALHAAVRIWGDLGSKPNPASSRSPATTTVRRSKPSTRETRSRPRTDFSGLMANG